MNSYHCPEYEELTIEDKLLVDKEMKEWFASAKLQDLCMPTFIFKVVEERIIERFKRKENDDRGNRKQSVSRTNH